MKERIFLKSHLWLIKLIGVIVPRRLRADRRRCGAANVALLVPTAAVRSEPNRGLTD
jgi:hypothetical protein